MGFPLLNSKLKALMHNHVKPTVGRLETKTYVGLRARMAWKLGTQPYTKD
jgi:hypothetical protein